MIVEDDDDPDFTIRFTIQRPSESKEKEMDLNDLMIEADAQISKYFSVYYSSRRIEQPDLENFLKESIDVIRKLFVEPEIETTEHFLYLPISEICQSLTNDEYPDVVDMLRQFCLLLAHSFIKETDYDLIAGTVWRHIDVLTYSDITNYAYILIQAETFQEATTNFIVEYVRHFENLTEQDIVAYCTVLTDAAEVLLTRIDVEPIIRHILLDMDIISLCDEYSLLFTLIEKYSFTHIRSKIPLHEIAFTCYNKIETKSFEIIDLMLTIQCNYIDEVEFTGSLEAAMLDFLRYCATTYSRSTTFERILRLIIMMERIPTCYDCTQEILAIANCNIGTDGE